MLDFAHQIVNYVTLHWAAISALVGGGAGLSVILEVTLHKLHIDSKKLAYSLLQLFAIAGAAAMFYLDNVNAVGTYAGLVIAAQTVHRFIVSPYYNKYIEPYLLYLSEKEPQNITPYVAPTAPVAPSTPVEQAPAFLN